MSRARGHQTKIEIGFVWSTPISLFFFFFFFLLPSLLSSHKIELVGMNRMENEVVRLDYIDQQQQQEEKKDLVVKEKH